MWVALNLKALSRNTTLGTLSEQIYDLGTGARTTWALVLSVNMSTLSHPLFSDRAPG